MKGYSYFIAYANYEGMGNCTLILDNEITDYGDISAIEKAIEENYDEGDITIINWILLGRVNS